MDVVTTMLGWVVMLACVYFAYIAVRELEQVVIRRPFSLLLTVLLVIMGSGLLYAGLAPLTTSLLQQYFYSDFGGEWYYLIGAALFIAAIVLVMRNVALRVQRGSCPSCNTALMGHVVCPSCGWGGLGLLGTVLGVARQSGASISAAPPFQASRPPSASAPTVQGTPYSAAQPASSPAVAYGPGAAGPITPGAPPAHASGLTPTVAAAPPGPRPAPATPARFCADCGAALTVGQSVCPRCGAAAE